MAILLIAIVIIYGILLYLRYKNDNPKINISINLLQGILWIILLVDSWQNIHLIWKTIYCLLAAISFFVAFRIIFKYIKERVS